MRSLRVPVSLRKAARIQVFEHEEPATVFFQQTVRTRHRTARKLEAARGKARVKCALDVVRAQLALVGAPGVVVGWAHVLDDDARRFRARAQLRAPQLAVTTPKRLQPLAERDGVRARRATDAFF